MAESRVLPEGVSGWHAAAAVAGAAGAALLVSKAGPALWRALSLDAPGGIVSPLHRRIFDATLAAQPIVQAHTMRTALLASEPLASASGAKGVWLKLESEQVTGSFKARGAVSALGQQLEAARACGVATASTGNHAKGVIRAFEGLVGFGPDTAVEVFVPASISEAKLRVLRSTGANVRVQASDDCEKAEAAARAWAAESGAVFVSPYNDLLVAGGQGTVGLEIAEQAPDGLDVVLVPVGGGGLIAGVAAALKARLPGVQVFGCQPEQNCCMRDSLLKGRILGEGEFLNGATLSDGTAGGIEAGSVTFEACKELVDGWLVATEVEILDAMAMVLRSHGKVVEGAAACAVACATAPRNRARFAGKNVGIVVCGGNVAPAVVVKVAQRAMEQADEEAKTA
ncbi:hypothetical protein FNF27_01381 [Cafeteria roenbergensis]|uniref:Tryptophan synthase beta chain-like PALP domain-containing protein n=1 Tax=Cafeteria roenbergensis TaxID=33653 RepID=A0A5A8EMR0_CAFRO|nr:hypothetical protein FNF27_01381 [Cafeteria roenbergensis]|mmetsp:Transcript_25972/g.97825  ORF Transcript_25972/g.97825 Transcript_25972/m.97825 type:complete len:398 (+) Transcript_25972:207-1400(+)